MHTLSRIALALGILAACCHGQDRWDEADFKSATISGLHLYSLSVFSGYTTLAGPSNTLQQLSTPGATDLGSTMTYGAQWTLGWRRQRHDYTYTASYSGTYDGQTAYANVNGFGHNLMLGVNRTFHKWTFNLSGNASYTTLAQYLYQPSAVSSLSQTPSSFNDLAAVYAIGTFSDMQVASMLTNTPITSTATAAGLLQGDRILTYGAQASASYAASSRLTFNLSSFTAGGQSNLDNKQAFVMPNSIGANAGVALSYSLSPRTSLGLNLTETRATNQYQGSYGTNVGVTLGRKMGPHWFMNAGVGAAYIKITEQVTGSAPSKQITGTGAIGYRAYAHTFIASYNRGTYDSYGLAAGVNTIISGAWTWRRPGSGWSTTAGFGRQQLRNTGFTTVSGWQANAGLSRAIGPQFYVRAEYIYFDSTGTFLGTTLDRTVHTARISLAWAPQETIH